MENNLKNWKKTVITKKKTQNSFLRRNDEMTKQKVLERDRNMLILGLYFTTFIRFTNIFFVSLITNHFYCSDEGKKCRKKLFNSNLLLLQLLTYRQQMGRK